ncbi:MAG: NAD-dependent DNA ligase LigA [Bacteroidota bacterium]|nr:NAD-dependent DNA ligase LigA [Bacteroidota bacterium]
MKNDQSIVRKAEELRKKIHHHDYLYYVLAQPEISDEKYDSMMRELQEMEAKYPQVITPDSPTQRVGGVPTKEFPTVKHSSPMLSLSNTYSEEDIRDFDRRIRNLLPDRKYKYVCELKFDGVSLSLRYTDSILTLGATRGDGAQGDDITSNTKTIRTIPLRLEKTDSILKNCEVRGEVVMNRDDFQRMNEEREQNEEKTFANPRNSVAGTLKLQDPKIVASRPLKFFAYSLLVEDKTQQSHYENLQLLKQLGFLVDDHAKLFGNIDDVIEHWKEWESKRDTLPFDIDGIVVKIDSIEQQDKLGTIAKSPRWAIACKFASKKGETKLKVIRLQVGRTGTITPVADLEPVYIGGTTITRASLYNEDYIRNLDIRIGDTVVVERGGDVIPKVTKVVLDKRPKHTKPYTFPTTCPECGTKLVKLQDEANYFCINIECPKQIRGRIEHWAARGAMDIDGLGEAVIDQLVTGGFIRNVADIYDFHKYKDKLVMLDRWGEKSVHNLLEGIENSKQRPYHRTLFSLGIKHVGTTVAQVLADHFNDINELMQAKQEDLQTIHEIGPKIAESIFRFFKDDHNKQLLARLKAAGIRLSEEKKKSNGILAGKTFLLTGTLTNMSRDQAKEVIEELGGKVAPNISKKVNILIVGEDAGSKLDKAKKLKIEIWNEEKFFEVIEKDKKCSKTY